MEFPSYGKAIECHNSSEYQSGWDLAKETTVRHMQVIEGFSTEYVRCQLISTNTKWLQNNMVKIFY